MLERDGKERKEREKIRKEVSSKKRLRFEKGFSVRFSSKSGNMKISHG